MSHNLFHFFSREAGQARRRALDEAIGGLVEYLTPPNLRPAAEFVAQANPIQGMSDSMTASRVVFDPDETLEARKRAALDMGIEMAFALTPAALAARGYLTPVQGVMESVLGGSPAQKAITDDLVERFTQQGEVPVMGSNLGNINIENPLSKKYEDLEVINPLDLIGAKISPTPADLTQAGTIYQGIDAAGTTRNTKLQGGPLFPLQEKYEDAGVGWMVDSASKGSTKLGKDSDFVAVTAMSPKAHQSNATIADAYMGTLEAYIKSGRLPDENIKKLNSVVTDFGKTTKDPELQKLNNFVGFDSPFFDDFMRNATFPQREAISKLMTSPKAMAIGGPNFQKVLDKTIQTEFAGTNLGDTLLLLELDKGRGLLNLADLNLPPHMSYDTGLGANVVGRFENPVSRGLLFPDFEAEYSSRPTMLNKSGNVDEARMAYSFGRALPSQEITPEGARNLFEALQYYNIDQPQQAQLIEQAIQGNWKTSKQKKISGGISPIDYERALQRNPSLPSLDPYTATDVTKGAKAGDFEVFQLGDADVFFGLKKNPDYTWMNDGKPIPELGDNEVDLVGVISNELGAKGVASPAILGKAIEQGATVLNAFAVPSQNFPEGFLPNVYNNYGFQEVKRIPFSKEFYIEERGQDAYDDLLRQWRSEGWNESDGMPDVVLMKWSGNDAERANASQKVFNEDFEGFGATETTDFVKEAIGTSQSSTRAVTEAQISGANIGSGDTGSIRSGGGTPQSSSIRRAAAELKTLTPEQRRNLGLLQVGF